MIQLDWFDSNMVKAAAVFLVFIMMASAIFMILFSSAGARNNEEMLHMRHSSVLNELEKKTRLRQKMPQAHANENYGTARASSSSSELLETQHLLRKEKSAEILELAVSNLRKGKDVQGARYLIAACEIWRMERNLGKLLMSLPILEDIILHMSPEDFMTLETEVQNEFRDIDTIIAFVLGSKIAALDRKKITEVKKMIHKKRTGYY